VRERESVCVRERTERESVRACVCVCHVRVGKRACQQSGGYASVYLMLHCVAVCCSVLQCVAARCSALQCVAWCCSVLQCVAVCCSVLWSVAGCGGMRAST